MNNTFSINRFGKLFMRHTAEHYKGYLMSLGVLAGIFAITFGLEVAIDEKPLDVHVQYSLFSAYMIVAGAIFTSTIFNDLNAPRKAIAALTLPASHLEKFLVKWIYSYLLFAIAFTCMFYLVLIPIQHTARIQPPQIPVMRLFEKGSFAPLLIIYSLMHTCMLFGAIIFRKGNVIKTSLSLMAIGCVVPMINKWILQSMLGISVNGSMPFVNFAFVEKRNNMTTSYLIDLPESTHATSYILVGVVTLLIWAVTYFKLKEKQA